MKLNKPQREALREKFGGKCAYCGCELQKGWHADHLEPCVRNRKYNHDKGSWEFDGTFEKPENNHIDNFNPSCPKCNINKHSFTLEQFRESIKRYIESLNKYSVQYQIAKKYGLVTETEIEVKFYFETVQEQTSQYCICDFVMVERNPNTDEARCFTCKKQIKE